MSFLRPPMRADVALRVAVWAGAVSSLALTAACAPDLGPMAKIKPASDYAAQKTLGEPTATAWPSDDWWTAYNDPQLTALIDEALKGAPDLRVLYISLLSRPRTASSTEPPSSSSGLRIPART